MLMVATVAAESRGPKTHLLDTLVGMAAAHELVIVLPAAAPSDSMPTLVRGLRERLPRWSVVGLYADEQFTRDKTALATLQDLLDAGALTLLAVDSDDSAVVHPIAKEINADVCCRLTVELDGTVKVDTFGPPGRETAPTTDDLPALLTLAAAM